MPSHNKKPFADYDEFALLSLAEWKVKPHDVHLFDYGQGFYFYKRHNREKVIV